HGQDRLTTNLLDHTWDRDNVVVGERATNDLDVPGFEREIDLLKEQAGELVDQPTRVVLLGPPGQQKHSGEGAEQCHVNFDVRKDTRSSHLHRDATTVGQHRPMYLGDRCT